VLKHHHRLRVCADGDRASRLGPLWTVSFPLLKPGSRPRRCRYPDADPRHQRVRSPSAFRKRLRTFASIRPPSMEANALGSCLRSRRGTDPSRPVSFRLAIPTGTRVVHSVISCDAFVSAHDRRQVSFSFSLPAACPSSRRAAWWQPPSSRVGGGDPKSLFCALAAGPP